MKLGFHSKINLGIFCLLLLLGTVVSVVVSRIMTDALLEENRNRGISIGINLAARVAEPILAMDFLRMKILVVETVRQSDDIFYTFILDDSGDTLVHSFTGGFPLELKYANTVSEHQPYHIRLLDTGKDLIYDYAVPVIISGNRFGTIRVGLLRTRIQEAINQIIWSTVLSTGSVILIAGVLGTLFARQFTRRIKILHQSSEQALSGNLDVHTAPLLKKNCWDIMACSRAECPAYGNLHHRCWYLAGTLCPTCVEGEYAKKIVSCRECIVYRKCSGDEIQSLAESFDSMTLDLKGHLSELKNAEKTLTEQRHLLRMILDATPDYVSLQDQNLIYQAANKAFCNMLICKENEIIGKTHIDLFSPSRAERYQEEDRHILKTGHPLIKENRISGSGIDKWLHIIKIPVRSDSGKIMGLLCSCRDITDFKKVQEQLVRAQKMEAVGQLTAGIAHEINTPLGIILGYAQLLLEETDAEDQLHEDLQIVEKQTKICKKIVSDLLSFSRHTEGTVAMIDLNLLISEAVSVVEHTFLLDQVSIETAYQKNLPAFRGDEEKIKQVLINLLNNARDAIGSGGVVSIRTEHDNKHNEIVISVADTGRGIPPDNIDRIFDPFYTTKPVGKGTGLGLSVTFGIVKKVGGRIEVESPPVSSFIHGENSRKGTVFIIYLPANGEKIKNGKNSSSG